MTAPPPSLPAVVARLLAACSEEQGSLSEVVRTLEADPGISSRLLRLSNSAYYGLSRQVDSLDRAVLLLGRATVQAVALAATVLTAWEGRPLPPQVEVLWIHAYLGGLGCRHLALRLPCSPWRSAGDTLFLTGLLHDIGRLLFLSREPDAYAEALETQPECADLLAWEERRFGSDHARMGGETLAAWQLPSRIAEVVRHHHSGGLRAELRADWEVLRAVDGCLEGAPAAADAQGLPPGLLADLDHYLDGAREEARAFYEAIA